MFGLGSKIYLPFESNTRVSDLRTIPICDRFDTHHEASKVQYLQTDYQKIDTWPGIAYPDASLERLETLLFCVILSIVVRSVVMNNFSKMPQSIDVHRLMIWLTRPLL